MGEVELTARFFDPVDKTLERIQKANILKNPSELPLDLNGNVFFLMPNGNYFWGGDTNHMVTMQRFATDQPRLPNGSMRPVEHGQYIGFYTDLHIIKVMYQPKPNNRIDYICLAPITTAQMRTIYRTQKDVPDLWVTYDIVDNEKPSSLSGEGYRDMLRDLRKTNYLA